MNVLDETRDWTRTSDHVPVIADFVASAAKRRYGTSL